jgi:hypothetical protein
MNMTQTPGMIASCNHGYVFVDSTDGEFINLWPIATRSGNAQLADAALTEQGYRRTTGWAAGKTHGELVAVIEKVAG